MMQKANRREFTFKGISYAHHADATMGSQSVAAFARSLLFILNAFSSCQFCSGSRFLSSANPTRTLTSFYPLF
jgi:hypothetical protein